MNKKLHPDLRTICKGCRNVVVEGNPLVRGFSIVDSCPKCENTPIAEKQQTSLSELIRWRPGDPLIMSPVIADTLAPEKYLVISNEDMQTIRECLQAISDNVTGHREILNVERSIGKIEGILNRARKV